MGESAIDALVTELIHGRITRRQFVGRAVALGVSASGVAVLLDACGAAATSATPTAVGIAANQTITIGQALDNYVATGFKSYIGAYPVNANIYEQLVRLNPDYSVSPWLAKSWEATGTNTGAVPPPNRREVPGWLPTHGHRREVHVRSRRRGWSA